MIKRKISAKILGVCMMALLVVGTSFAAMLFTRAADVSAAAVLQKNIMTVKNQKIFKGYISEYYTDCLSFDKNDKPLKVPDFSGSISLRKLGDGMMICALNKNQYGISLKKYTDDGTAKEQWKYVLPQAIGDKVIKSCFDIKMINRDKISFYNAKSKKYVVSGGDFPQDNFAVSIIKSIKKTGNNIVVTASFYEITSDGHANYKKKLQSMKFTFRVSNGKYLFSKIQTI